MFRYLERAEHTARLLDAGMRMALTRDLVTSEEEWRSVIETSGQLPGYARKHSSFTGMQVWNYILRDKDNPASVLAILNDVRQNARLVRNAITRELWCAINESWLTLSEQLARPVSESRFGEVIASVRRAGTLAHGAMQTAMLRDEGYHFCRAGTFIERADSVARILDMKYFILLPSLSWVGSSLDNSQWDMILRSVSGDRAYRWLNAGQVDPRGICNFLILDGSFPRSLTFCLREMEQSVSELARLQGGGVASLAAIASAQASIRNIGIDDIFDQGLHEFLHGFIRSNAEIADAIASDFRFLG